MPSGITCSTCETVSPTGTPNCPKCGATLLEPTTVRKPRTTGSLPATQPKKARATGQNPALIPLEEGQTNSGRADPLIGQKLQEYVIRQRIGVGGMGIVYRAEQTMIGKQVAIKVLRPDVVTDPRDMERLLDEARVVNSINHRGIINIFGAGTTDSGRHYLIMELLDGESLEDRMSREGIINSADAVIILEEVLSALGAAHQAGVVHRDLKPANVFLAREGTKFYVKLLDFGLARRQQANVTRIAGTPDYISPEHARGKVAGPPADLYAFGILCFHMLTGRLPFEGTTPMEVMEKHVHSPPPVPHELNREIPQALSELILKLLIKDPTQRPDANQVKADLKAATKQLRNASTMMALDAVDAKTNPTAEAAPTPVSLPAAPAVKAQRTEPTEEKKSRLPIFIGIALVVLLVLIVLVVVVLRSGQTAVGIEEQPVEVKPVIKPVEPIKDPVVEVKPTQDPVVPQDPPPEDVPVDDNAPLSDDERKVHMKQLGIDDSLLGFEVNFKDERFPQELRAAYVQKLEELKGELEAAHTHNQLITVMANMGVLRRALDADLGKIKTLGDDPPDAGAPIAEPDAG